MGNDSWMQGVIRARVLVAALGEAARPAWWRSDATTAASLRMLERLYPRTFQAASLSTASRAAANEHDAHIGKTGIYHLFRLPVGDETALHEHMMVAPPHEQTQLLSAPPTTEEQLAALVELARAERPTQIRGPVAVGALAELHGGAALRRMCAAYAAGFAEQQAIYPYLVKADAP